MMQRSDAPQDARHAVVVGAGIVGIATALHLQRQGLRVTLADPEPPGSLTSSGNAGIIACAAFVPISGPGLPRALPSMLLRADSPLFLRWRNFPALAPWMLRFLAHCGGSETRRIAAALDALIAGAVGDHVELARGTPAERRIRPCAHMYAYRSERNFMREQFAWRLRKELGINYEVLRDGAVAEAEPTLGPDVRLLVRCPEHAYIDDPALYAAELADALERRGGRILRARVDDILLAPAQGAGQSGGSNGALAVTGVVAGRERIPADAVVLAAGAWSAPLARKLGLRPPVVAERGYHIELWEPSVMPRNPVMFDDAKCVATPMEGRLRVAGLDEFAALDAPPARAPAELMERVVRTAIPGLTWKRRSEWMGRRSALPDSLPLIGPAPGARGAWCAFGHHHIGLAGAPRTGQWLAAAIAGKPPNRDLAPFAPARYAARRGGGRE